MTCFGHPTITPNVKALSRQDKKPFKMKYKKHKNTKSSEHCFGRISEQVFKELKSLTDLIEKLGTFKNRSLTLKDANSFKNRLKNFKEFLEIELSEFSVEEILKIDLNYQKFKKIYEWKGVDELLVAIEYETRKEKAARKNIRKHFKK